MQTEGEDTEAVKGLGEMLRKLRMYGDVGNEAQNWDCSFHDMFGILGW